MKLSPNFMLTEFTRSAIAKKRGLSNEPTAEHIANLRKLSIALEAVRTLVGRAVIITSGYRSPTVNAAVGGVPGSAHGLGHACDIRVHDTSAKVLARLIRDSDMRFDQLILETNRGVVHLSVDPRLRQQVLTQAGGPGTPIVQGIV
jgi:putative chitinase